MLHDWPPAMVIGLVATFMWAAVVGGIAIPFARAWARRIENRNAPNVPPDVSARLQRIEAAVDSIAVEIERISEAQRFLTKIQAERAPLASGAAPADRQR